MIVDEMVREIIQSIIGSEELPDDPTVDLVSYGMSSLDIMRAAGLLSKQGLPITFAEMIAHPTLAAWMESIERNRNDRSDGRDTVTEEQPAADESFELTKVQQAYFVGRDESQLLGGTSCHAYFEFEGKALDPKRLERAFYALAARHPLLRTRFTDEGVAYPLKETPWQGLEIYDLSSADDAEGQLARIRADLSHRKLDVEAGVVFDSCLVLLPHGQTRLCMSIDLLAADVMSIKIVLRELAALYRGESLPALTYTFTRYRANVEEQEQEASDRDAAYWATRIEELPAAPHLPLTTPISDLAVPHFTRRSFVLGQRRSRAFMARAQLQGVTLPMAVASLYAHVLSIWSNTSHFLLNMPLYNRKPIDEGVDSIVSDFSSLMLLEADTSNADSLGALVQRIQRRFREDAAHSGYGGTSVLADLSRVRGEVCLAPVVFASNIGGEFIDAGTRETLGTLSYMLAETPQTILDHQLYETEQGLLFVWDFVDEILDARMIEEAFSYYQQIVEYYGGHDWSDPFPL
ncbi:condensation domain-containing protein, partial [Curtanaerobium respiraculi]